ncbi:hypothetical protein WHT83_15085 [Aminobacter sp. P9b]|uniref:hypothetical protein n=1 Tax=Aminobacter sp. P9b TaxID=3133697 RepID=UPI0032443064
MPQPNKSKPFPLSNLNDGRQLVRVRCAYCKRTHHYFPGDLIQIFGDVDVDSLMQRMTCEAGDHGLMKVEAVYPTGKEAVGMKIRRLVAIKIRRVPVWREE